MIKGILVNPDAIDGEEIEPFKFHPYVKPGDAYLLFENGTFQKTTIRKINEILEPLLVELENKILDTKQG